MHGDRVVAANATPATPNGRPALGHKAISVNIVATYRRDHVRGANFELPCKLLGQPVLTLMRFCFLHRAQFHPIRIAISFDHCC